FIIEDECIVQNVSSSSQSGLERSPFSDLGSHLDSFGDYTRLRQGRSSRKEEEAGSNGTQGTLLALPHHTTLKRITRRTSTLSRLTATPLSHRQSQRCAILQDAIYFYISPFRERRYARSSEACPPRLQSWRKQVLQRPNETELQRRSRRQWVLLRRGSELVLLYGWISSTLSEVRSSHELRPAKWLHGFEQWRGG
ncbi:hypothetical protein CB0940_03766, partial [Cercospora beticola]